MSMVRASFLGVHALDFPFEKHEQAPHLQSCSALTAMSDSLSVLLSPHRVSDETVGCRVALGQVAVRQEQGAKLSAKTRYG